ncbi:hypothetical protein Bca101_027147 [Brassica carinata]
MFKLSNIKLSYLLNLKVKHQSEAIKRSIKVIVTEFREGVLVDYNLLDIEHPQLRVTRKYYNSENTAVAKRN